MFPKGAVWNFMRRRFEHVCVPMYRIDWNTTSRLYFLKEGPSPRRESFNKATVYLNGCARMYIDMNARIFSPHERDRDVSHFGSPFPNFYSHTQSY